MPIRYQKISSYKYRLAEPYIINVGIRPSASIVKTYLQLGTDGNLWLSAGYAWDGASGAVDSPAFMRGSLVHDALRQMMSEGLLSDNWMSTSDRILYNICIDDGMSRIRARWVLMGVSAARWYFKTGLAKWLWARKNKVLTAGKN